MASKKKVAKPAGKKKNVVKTMPVVIKKTSAKKVSSKTKVVNPNTIPAAPAKVDTSTPVNKWVGSVLDACDYELESIRRDGYSNSNEHKMFEAANVQKADWKLPFWTRVLWWFVKK